MRACLHHHKCQRLHRSDTTHAHAHTRTHALLLAAGHPADAPSSAPAYPRLQPAVVASIPRSAAAHRSRVPAAECVPAGVPCPTHGRLRHAEPAAQSHHSPPLESWKAATATTGAGVDSAALDSDGSAGRAAAACTAGGGVSSSRAALAGPLYVQGRLGTGGDGHIGGPSQPRARRVVRQARRRRARHPATAAAGAAVATGAAARASAAARAPAWATAGTCGRPARRRRCRP
jgi:hypothetical protein